MKVLWIRKIKKNYDSAQENNAFFKQPIYAGSVLPQDESLSVDLVNASISIFFNQSQVVV